MSEGIELVGVDTTSFANNINEIFLSDPENVIALSHAGEDITDDFFQTARECFQHEAWDEFYTFCVENVGTIKRFDDSVQMGARGWMVRSYIVRQFTNIAGGMAGLNRQSSIREFLN